MEEITRHHHPWFWRQGHRLAMLVEKKKPIMLPIVEKKVLPLEKDPSIAS